LPIQALLTQVAVTAFQHRQQQVALLFFIERGGGNHGLIMGQISQQIPSNGNAFRADSSWDFFIFFQLTPPP
jgi:hypothetical protein